MDHIPLPHKNQSHKAVPFLAQAHPGLSYDYLGFKEFPQRKGFDNHTLLRTNATTNPTEHAAIFQSWCFFGLVIEFFAAAKIKVTVEDFLCRLDDGEIRLTASRLPSLSRRVEMTTRDMPFGDRADILSTVKPHLATAGIITRRLATKSDDSIWQVVHLSALMLGERLTSMMQFFLYASDSTPSPWFGRSALTIQLMDEAGWCPSLSRTLEGQEAQQSFIYYLGRMHKSDVAQDHLGCNSTHCLLDKLNHETYETKHGNECRGLRQCSNFALDPPEWDSLMEIVKKHQVPLLTVAEGVVPHEIKVSVASSEQGMASSGRGMDGRSFHRAQPYVCISHVWSELVLPLLVVISEILKIDIPLFVRIDV